MTAPHRATENSQTEIVKILLDKDVEVNVKDDLEGFTPFLMSALWGNAEIASLLLEHGTDPDATTYGDCSAADLAEKANHHAVIRDLETKKSIK